MDEVGHALTFSVGPANGSNRRLVWACPWRWALSLGTKLGPSKASLGIRLKWPNDLWVAQRPQTPQRLGQISRYLDRNGHARGAEWL